tara:strand:- start:704 stop:1126 length:423 start_codon:yes stop_codon:yes gene_type:complete
MTTRQTSIDCYNEIKAKGLLSKKRLEVYKAILNNAPCTSSEAMVGNLNSTNVLSQSRARFTELRELGVIYERRERKCRVTGRNVIEWDLTDNLPKNIKLSKDTKKNRVNDALSSLRKLYRNKNTSTDQDWKDVADLIKGI